MNAFGITSDRAHAGLLRLGLLVGFALGLGGAIPVSAQEIVGELALNLPAPKSFLLHATLPLPRGVMQPGAALSPLSILLPDGTRAVTQAESVSRYAASADGTDVVELYARVERPPGASPGDRVTYEVARLPQGPAQLTLHPAVEELLSTPGAFQMRTRDLFEHRYLADLGAGIRKGSYELRRDGAVVRELTLHRILLPEFPASGPEGTLPHMMGIRAWIRTFDSEGYILLDLEVHNGFDGRNPDDERDDLLNSVYFRDLRLRLPGPWRVLPAFESPVMGPILDVGALRDHQLLAEHGEALYVMPRQARMVRRYAIALPGWEGRARVALEERGLAFARRGTSPTGEPLWSWWNPKTARYFPQRFPLPTLDHLGLAHLDDELQAELKKREQQLAEGSKGSYPMFSQLLGWAHPWGVAYGGMTGGDEINPWDGLRVAAAGSRAGYRLAQLITRAYSDRQPTALYDLQGRPTQVPDLLIHGPNGPYAVSGFYIRPQAGFGFEDVPDFQDRAAKALGLRERSHEALEQFQPIDLQHYIRYTRNLKVLTWLGNDSLARHLLIASAEVFHLSFHRFPVGAWGYAPGSGLLAKMNHVKDYPGQGVALGRGEAWGIDCASAAYSVAGEAWRQAKLPWFERIAQLVEDGQSTCTGNIQAEYFSKLFGGRYLVRRANESAFLEHALVGMNESVFRGADPERATTLDDIVVASVRAGLQAPFWNAQDKGIWWSVGVAPTDSSLGIGEFCEDVPHNAYDTYVDREDTWSPLAYAYVHSGDPLFLQRAEEMLGGPLWTSLVAGGETWLESRSALLALAQSLYGN